MGDHDGGGDDADRAGGGVGGPTCQRSGGRAGPLTLPHQDYLSSFTYWDRGIAGATCSTLCGYMPLARLLCSLLTENLLHERFMPPGLATTTVATAAVLPPTPLTPWSPSLSLYPFLPPGPSPSPRNPSTPQGSLSLPLPPSRTCSSRHKGLTMGRPISAGLHGAGTSSHLRGPSLVNSVVMLTQKEGCASERRGQGGEGEVKGGGA